MLATNSSERRGVFSAYVAFFFAALNFAQRAREAAAIRFLPAAEIFRVRFTGTEAIVFSATGFDPLLAIAHRFFCARLIRLRADADNVRCPSELELPKAAKAAVNRWTSCCALFSSLFKYPTTRDICFILFPLGRDCN